MIDIILNFLTYALLGFLALGIVVGCFAFLILARQMMREEQNGGSNA